MVESEHHKQLKNYAKLLLSKKFHIPREFIFEEFPLGNIRPDIIAYPPVGLKYFINGKLPAIIGVECGNIKSNIEANYIHFKEMLELMDLVIWIPYKLLSDNPFYLTYTRINEIICFIRSFEIFDEKFSKFSNFTDNEICGIIITVKGRFPIIDKYFRPIRCFSFS